MDKKISVVFEHKFYKHILIIYQFMFLCLYVFVFTNKHLPTTQPNIQHNLYITSPRCPPAAVAWWNHSALLNK